MKCALCGHEFSPDEAGCTPSCPMAGGCAVVCCPRCGYGAPDEQRSSIVRLARKAGDLLRKGTPRREEAPR